MADGRRIIQAGLLAVLVWMACCFYVQGGRLLLDPDLAYMARLASERVWSAIFLLAANIGAFGLFSERKAIRLCSVLVLSTAHGVIAGCFIVGGASLWSGIFLVVAAMGYYLGYEYTREIVGARTHAGPLS